MRVSNTLVALPEGELITITSSSGKQFSAVIAKSRRSQDGLSVVIEATSVEELPLTFVMLKLEQPSKWKCRQRPWCARITGRDPLHGLARDFIPPLADWSDAHRTCSGRVYGVSYSFPLKAGNLYEVAKYKGGNRSSRGKHLLVKEFVAVKDGKIVTLEWDEAMGLISGMDRG